MQPPKDEFDPPFEIIEPDSCDSAVVFNSPHSGRVYPSDFLIASRLDLATLRRSEDSFVDELFSGVVERGHPLMRAHFPRCYVDVNREPYELDPELFHDPVPPFANSQSVRVVGGLGTIARIVADCEEIYRERMPVARALERIELLYKPYHAALARLVEDTRRRFGIAVLIDCHSMPSASIGQPSSSRPDIVLGDRYGASCDVKVTRGMRAIFAEANYEVHLNRPYAGGFITEHYGRPHRGVHALQIEVNRALYLEETTFERSQRFQALRSDLARIMARATRELPGLLGGRAAAE